MLCAGAHNTYVDSVVRVVIDAIRGRVTHPGPVNLAFGTRTSLLELLRLLEVELGASLNRLHEAAREADIYDSSADGSLLATLFPQVAPTDLATGLGRTVDWFRASRSQSGVGA